MIKSILTLLDATPSGQSAGNLSIALAKQFDASVTALSVLNLESVDTSLGMLVRSPLYGGKRDEAKIDKAWSQLREARDAFEKTCESENIDCQTMEHEGHAFGFIQYESPAHDLIIIGKDLNFDLRPSTNIQETIGALLRASSRPMMIMPHENLPATGGSVLIAYDGSTPAAETLQLFVQLGLAKERNAHVLTAADSSEEAEHLAAKAVEYLGNHSVETQMHAIDSSDPTGAIESKISELGPDILVMGAYGRRGWREYVLGSSTSALIKYTPVPIFIHH